MSNHAPWHAGEIALQKRYGSFEQMADVGPRFIRNAMPEQHQAFFEQLPFLLIGTVDGKQLPWASLVTGVPRFISSLDDRTLAIGAMLSDSDPARSGLQSGLPVGLLGIELSNRRRNRMNGNVIAIDEQGFAVEVEHSFGNCPKYIQLRHWQAVDNNLPLQTTAESLSELDDDARALISGADTFFVASYADIESGGRQIDVSHRGGKSGFVRVDTDGTLTIPDFSGNRFFNTLGNILASGKAGLLFIDFDTGDVLQLSGTSEVIHENEAVTGFAGAERLWRVRPQRIVRRREATRIRWTLAEKSLSPFLSHTGSWTVPADRHAMQLRLFQIVDESLNVRSLYWERVDGKPLPSWQAGQHLTLLLDVAGEPKSVRRNYTVSSAPADGLLRISVKRQGLASQYLHNLQVGAVVEASNPKGGFTIDTGESRPAVLLAGGIGVTPILAMARQILADGKQNGQMRRTIIFQSDRNLGERAFAEELKSIATASKGAIRLVRLLTDGLAAEPISDYDRIGAITMDVLKAELGFDDYDFYLCGPPSFMQAVYDGLSELNVPDARIHAETFGPAGLKRRPAVAVGGDRPTAPVSDQPVAVHFAKSGVDAIWKPGDGTLLELAERTGLAPEYSCRNGSCGSCAVRHLDGAVAYADVPSAPINKGEALICSAAPAQGSGPITLDV